MSFFNHTSTTFKINTIKTLNNRAYKLASSCQIFSVELDFLRDFFNQNGYPAHIIDKCYRNFLNSLFSQNPIIHTVKKQQFFASLPYYSEASELDIKQLANKLKHFYPQLDIFLATNNKFKIGSFFSFKDRISDDVRSNVIYKFTCGCNATYIGCTRQSFKVRICQDLGKSARTGRQLATVMHSVPRTHSENCNNDIASNNFTIVDTVNNHEDLLLLESLHIRKQKPNLNLYNSSCTLLATPEWLVTSRSVARVGFHAALHRGRV